MRVLSVNVECTFMSVGTVCIEENGATIVYRYQLLYFSGCNELEVMCLILECVFECVLTLYIY